MPEYDFSKGVRGKYSTQLKAGKNIIILEPDVAKKIRDSASVDETLRAVVAIARSAR